MDRPIRFSSFVVKVASRCNLNCDYCYMYQHADQTWKDKPRVLSTDHQLLFIQRLKEYVLLRKLNRILIVFHGGEPLLFGADRLISWALQISEALNNLGCRVDFGIQTNGVLLKEKYLQEFEKHNISVSLSIDGPKEIHDSHRLDMRNKPTFDKVYQALLLLKKFPSIFTGCISVIDPNFDPLDLFNFYHEAGIAECNILIPDANYITPPKGRDKNPNLYKDWLIRAFDVWFSRFSHIKCKFFDQLLLGIMGKQTQTDSFGLGDISLLVLETDGTYHNHDVLKITEENTSSLGLSLENNRIEEAETAEKIAFHRHLLTKEGLSSTCNRCKHLDVCGGGFIAHRFDKNGYKNPTVYCEEMYALIEYATERVHREISQSPTLQRNESWDATKMELFWDPKTSSSPLQELIEYRAKNNYTLLNACLPYYKANYPAYSDVIDHCQQLTYEACREALLEPEVNAWIETMSAYANGSKVLNIDGVLMPVDLEYFSLFIDRATSNKHNQLRYCSTDRWIRNCMSSTIILDHSSEEIDSGMATLREALKILHAYDAELHQEFFRINRLIQLVKDTSAPPDKDVSFSDEMLPGTIFLTVWQSNGSLNPHVVTASLIHEHLHQKLYLLMNRYSLFTDQDTLIYSPWPKVLRPPHGVLHAVYVFIFVAKFWNTLLQQQIVDDSFAHHLETHIEYLEPCINEIKEKVSFTKEGRLFFNLIVQEFEDLSRNSFLLKT